MEYGIERANQAAVFLQRTEQVIEPKKSWKGDSLSQYGWSGRIPSELRAEPGRVLSIWGDAGWGTLVKHGKQHDGRFDDALVQGLVEMIRERYALSDYALVVSASLEQGGTWSGAVENLTQQWVPLLVRATQPMLPGNQRLIERGGLAFTHPTSVSETSIRLWLEQQSETTDGLQQPAELDADRVTNRQVPNDAGTTPHVDPNNKQPDLFVIVWPYLEEALQTERTDRELADHFAIELAQVRAWLQRAIEGRISNALIWPLRHAANC